MATQETKQGHTPGPWEAIRDSGHLRLQQWDIYADNGRGKLIAEVLGDNAEANATLIAAAPDMLEALTRILARASSGDEADHFSETFDGDVEFAHTAIAKAT